jgi:hypothetical protein
MDFASLIVKRETTHLPVLNTLNMQNDENIKTMEQRGEEDRK